jgi:hypothetical protein
MPINSVLTFIEDSKEGITKTESEEKTGLTDTDMDGHLLGPENGKGKEGKTGIVFWTIMAPGGCTCRK